MSDLNVTHIRTRKALAELIERALEVRCIGLDTEFVWERTYYPRLAVVQIGFSEREAFIIDVPAIKEISPLGKVLSDPETVKVLHDAQQDLIILRRETGAFPKNIFDTKCAAGFVGLSSTVSLNSLLRQTLGISLSKTETRTDWLQRPLSERQIAYAVDDVRFLPRLYKNLLFAARDRGREAWLVEELAEYDRASLYTETDPTEQFLKVKGAGKLESQKLMVLKELAAWREQEARRQNCPRAWILSDEALIAIARKRPRTLTDLDSIKIIPENQRYLYKDALLEIIGRALVLPQGRRYRYSECTKTDESLNAKVDLVQAFLKGKGMAAGIDPALLANRNEITALVREGIHATSETHRLLQGWRRKFIGNDLLLLMAGKIAVRLNPETGLPQSTGEENQ